MVPGHARVVLKVLGQVVHGVPVHRLVDERADGAPYKGPIEAAAYRVDRPNLASLALRLLGLELIFIVFRVRYVSGEAVDGS